MVELSTGRLHRAEYVIAVSAAVFVGMLAAASFFAGGDAVLAHVSGIGLPVVVMLLLLSLFNYFVRAYRWHVFSEHLHVNVPLTRTILYYFSGFSMT